MTSTAFTAASLFSGCGGFCEGVRLAGFDVRSAVEIDPFAAETYRANFPDVPLFEGNIADFLRKRSRVWEGEAARFRTLPLEGLDLLFGGPPCQGYSQIGTRLLDDPRNSLYREFIRILRTLRPRVFLMENVPNMLLLSRGIFRDQVLDAFQRAGYGNSAVRIVSASDYGVPQLRKRAIFFGVRDDLTFDADAGAWLDAVLVAERQPQATVRDAIYDLPETVSHGKPLPYPESGLASPVLDELRLDREGRHYSSAEKLARTGSAAPRLYNHHTKEIQERRLALIALLAPGMKGNSLPGEVWNGLRPEKWRRLHPDRPAYTILAQMHRDLSEWVHPEFQRWITVREAARLQSFHDGFIFKSSEWQMLKQIGNAVPPLLGRAIGTVVRRALEELDGAPTASVIGQPVALRLAI